MENDAAALSLLAEWEERRDRGEAVTPEELCAAAPHLAAALRRLIGLLEGCDRLLGTDEETLSAAPSIPVPARFGGYEVQGELGRGGMGVVYRAWDPALQRTVALKTLRPALPTALDDARRIAGRFRQEGQVLARLRHEHIVPIYEAKLDDDGPYFVMEYVPGGSLAEHREKLTAAGPVAIANFLERVARAVAFAHAHGVLHRDLKPANILLDADGRPRVSDFGLAKLLDPSIESCNVPPGHTICPDDTTDALAAQLTVPGHQPGTRAYMAPEQIDPAFGSVGPATDIWALGVILYELLTGRRPFPGNRRAELREQVCRETLPPLGRGLQPRALGRRLERVARRCLEKDPAKRYRTAGELADDLYRCAMPRQSWRVATAASVVLCLALGGAAAFWPKPKDVGPVWPNLPAVQQTLSLLQSGQPVVLIDRGAPAAFDWALGEGSGKVLLESDGIFTVISSLGTCLVELMPGLPPGRYRIDAEVRHVNGGDQSTIGIYAANSRCQTGHGRQNLFVRLDYADLGPKAMVPVNGPDGFQVLKGIAGLAAQYACESTTPETRGVTQLDMNAIRHFDSARALEVEADWRPMSLVVDASEITATLDHDRVGTTSARSLEGFRRSLNGDYPDLGDMLPVRMHGGLGIYLHMGVASVRQFKIQPLPHGVDIVSSAGALLPGEDNG